MYSGWQLIIPGIFISLSHIACINPLYLLALFACFPLALSDSFTLPLLLLPAADFL
jgi:hypothetical protein